MKDVSFLFSLKVGAVVEAKNPDGQFMEGVINKLTDASVYTVGKNSIFRYQRLCIRELSFTEPKTTF